MKHVFCLFSVNSYSTYIYCPELYLFFNYTTCCSHLYCTCTICSDESSSSSSYNLKPTSLCSLGLKMKLCFHRLNECCIRYKKCVACILKYNISWAKLHIYSIVSRENLKNSVLTQGNNNNNKKKDPQLRALNQWAFCCKARAWTTRSMCVDQ